MLSRLLCVAFLLLSGASQLVDAGDAAAQTPAIKGRRMIELPPAKVGEPYTYKLETNHAATFVRVDGKNTWLRLEGGELKGTPLSDEPAKATIEVLATSIKGPIQTLEATFVVPVEQRSCGNKDDNELAWCEGAERQSRRERIGFDLRDGGESCVDMRNCILQFDRPTGWFGHYKAGAKTAGSEDPEGVLGTSIVNAINGSKVLFSGSVLIYSPIEDSDQGKRHAAVPDCRFWSWSVVTQTVDSSNNLFYGPSDVTAYCTSEGTALIVLPVHAIWADVYGVPANTNDPTWKANGAPPPSHECWTGATAVGAPTQGITPCDALSKTKAPVDPKPDEYRDQQTSWLMRELYSPISEFWYNRFEEPGVSQGSLSIAPIDYSTKMTMDVQGYESTRWGRGWIGIQTQYEQDRNLKDDLNSLTSALTYDVRIPPNDPGNPWWGKWWAPAPAPCESAGKCSPPTVGIRPAEFTVRAGGEWSPDEFKYPTAVPVTINGKPSTVEVTQYLPRDVNYVMAGTLRLPIIASPWIGDVPRQQSQITVAPVVGLEGGFRITKHEICTGLLDRLCAPQPKEVYRRLFGGDASLRWPYNFTRNFLGDRPLTTDYSYRLRQLSYAEPFSNQFDAEYVKPFIAEGQSTGWRSYSRITFIAPYSAYFQLRITWQHGTLPPMFQYVGNQVTVGVTFSNPGSSEH